MSLATTDLALRTLGYKTVRSYVQEATEAEAFLLGLAQGLTETDVAKKIGRKQQHVSARLSLLKLPSNIQGLITSRLSKIEDSMKQKILAELSRRDGEDALTLQQFRVGAKSLEELASDPKAKSIILQLDPAWGIKRVEARLADLDEWAREATEGSTHDLHSDV